MINFVDQALQRAVQAGGLVTEDRAEPAGSPPIMIAVVGQALQ